MAPPRKAAQAERESHDGSAFSREMLGEERPSKDLTFPHPYTKRPVRAKLVVLTQAEQAQAAAGAANYLTAELKLDEYKLALSMETELYRNEEQLQRLALALRDPEDAELPFAEVGELRDYLTDDHRELLLNHLVAYTIERSPLTSEHDPKKVMELLRGLKEVGGLSDALNACDTATLRSIALSLAEVLVTPMNPSSSDASNSSSQSENSSATPTTP
jgi:hypothetical protein